MQTVRAPDGTPIAVVRTGVASGPPILLVHGAAADHTTWRVLGPILGERHDVWAMDRRGRGGSGDSGPYAIEREFEDVAAVAAAISADRDGRSVAVVGHSYGGRCALGATLRTSAIGSVVSYEGAPAPADARYGDDRLVDELVRLANARALERVLETFMERVVGMTPVELARYRADPVWPRRVAAAGTIARELAAESGRGGDLDALGAVRRPVLQVLGGASRPEFALATHALQARLADGRVATIPGAKHAAHHTHPVELAGVIEAFLGATAHGSGADDPDAGDP